MGVYVCVKGRGGQMGTSGQGAEEGVDLRSLWRKNGQDVVPDNGRGSHLFSCVMLLGRRWEVRVPLRMARFWGSLEDTGPFRCWSAVDRWQSSLHLEKGTGLEKQVEWNSWTLAK